MARRTGIPAIQQVAKNMCRLITKFTPIIKIVTSNDAGVTLALDTAAAACSALDEALQEYRDFGD